MRAALFGDLSPLSQGAIRAAGAANMLVWEAPFGKGGAPKAGGFGQRMPGARRLRSKRRELQSCRARLKLATEPADKPGSVRCLRTVAIIPLGASSPKRSSNLPGGSAGRITASLFGLAPGGVCRAGLLPDSRCALTAPFHPCPHPEGPSAVSFCCTFRRLAPPKRYLAPYPVEPGLSSAPVAR